MAAERVSLRVISWGTHADEVLTANIAASAMSDGCRHLSATNIPSVIGVFTAAG